MELAVAGGEDRYAPASLHSLTAHIQQHCPLLGQRVAVVGLGRDDMSGIAVDFGCRERAVDDGGWLIASGRYVVKLDGREGKRVRVKPSNLKKSE